MATLVNDTVVAYFLVVTTSVAVVTMSGLIASRFFMRHPAIRHCILLVALLCSLVTPLIASVFVGTGRSLVEIPLLSSERTFSHTPAPPWTGRSSATDPELVLPGSSQSLDESVEVRKVNPRFTPDADPQRSWATIVVAIFLAWAVGTVGFALEFFRRLQSLRKLRQSCRPCAEPALHKSLQEAGRRVGIEHLPTVAISRELRVPVVIGPLRPVLVLPDTSLDQTNRTFLCDVLVHELAHIVRRDHLVLTLQEFARIIFWPIVFIHLLNRELTQAREEVCDNYVLAYRDPVSYGETLLHLAELAIGGSNLSPSVGILNWHGRLEQRIAQLVGKGRNTMVRPNPLTVCAVLVLFSLGSVLLCSTTVFSADEKDNDESRLLAAHKMPVVAENFFIAPVTTELQKLKLGVADDSQINGKNYVAYLNVNASSFIVPGWGLSDLSGQGFEPIRRSLKAFAQGPEQGKLLVTVVYGPHTVGRSAARLIGDIFRGMAQEAGFSGAEVRALHTNPVDNDAVHKWHTLPLNVGQRGEDEQKVKVGSVSLYPVVTALSRFLMNDADLYIDVESVKSLQTENIFTADEKTMVQNAIERLGMRTKEKVCLAVVIQEPKGPYDISDLPQVRQDAVFHKAAVESLKGAGFNQVSLEVRVGSNLVRSLY